MDHLGKPAIIAVNAAGIALGSYGLAYLSRHVTLPPHLAGAGQWQFLTNLSLLFSLLVYVLGILAHVRRSPQLFSLKNNLHPIALVLESVVTVIYWPLRLLFLHMLVKNPQAKLIPLFVDVCVHLVPVVVLVVDFFLFMPRWGNSPAAAAVTCLALSALYYGWLRVLVKVEAGAEYPYQFLNVPTESQRIAIFGFVAMVGFGSFCAWRWAHDVLRPQKRPQKRKHA